MAQQHRSPASYIWPHLAASQPEPPPQRRERNELAEAMYPTHRTLAPKPPTAAEVRQQWGDYMLSLSGLRRKR